MSSSVKPLRNVAEPAADLTMRWLSSMGPSFHGENSVVWVKSVMELER